MILETLVRLEPFCEGDCAARVVEDGQTPALLVKQGERYVAAIPLGPVEYGYIQQAVAAPQRFQSALHFVVALKKGCLNALDSTH